MNFLRKFLKKEKKFIITVCVTIVLVIWSALDGEVDRVGLFLIVLGILIISIDLLIEVKKRLRDKE